MTILFLCASLEAGRDGVGDYTRQLASACAGRGHGCTVIALHDPFVGAEEDTGSADGLRFIRLSSRQDWAERLDRVLSLVDTQGPQWISWQMVTYGYNPRGLLPRALHQLAAALSGVSHQVMLHELWIGLEQGAPWSQRIQGWVQRLNLTRWLRQLPPSVLQTSNRTYQQVLARAGFDASVLPLFGNVPLGLESATPRPAQPVELVAVTFGTLHPQWRPAETAAWLQAAAQSLGRTPSLIAIGRTGQSGALDAFRQAGIKVHATGEQETPVISALLAGADFGIALHPWALIGKSGVAAAMLDHGLPVLVPRNEWQLRESAAVPGTTRATRLRLQSDLAPASAAGWLALRQPARATLPEVATLFLASLAQA